MMQSSNQAATQTYSHVVFHVARNYKNVWNLIQRAEIVQQSQVCVYLRRVERIEGLLMKQIADVTTNNISASVSVEQM